MALVPADRVTVVEHDPADHLVLPGGKVHGASVIHASRLFVQVAYDDVTLTRTGTDLFLAETGWRAFEGTCRWRLRGPDGWLS